MNVLFERLKVEENVAPIEGLAEHDQPVQNGDHKTEDEKERPLFGKPRGEGSVGRRGIHDGQSLARGRAFVKRNARSSSSP